MNEREASRPETVVAVPVSELRKLADLLGALDLDLADDLVAGLANRVLRNLARRWADTVSVWAVEPELWGEGEDAPMGATGGGGRRVAALTERELGAVIRVAAAELASRQGRSPEAVLADLAREVETP